jgi:hypothetical protein
MKKSLLLLISIFSVSLLLSCGGSSTTPPPVATHFSVTSPISAATAGTVFKVTVTALDSSNAEVSSYAGTLHFTSTDPQAVLQAATTLKNGTGTFPATLKTVGGQTITATDTTSASITGASGSITVSAAAPSRFSVSAPATAAARVTFSFTVSALDAYNNPATSYAGTVHFTSSDAKAVLPSNSPLPNGVANFYATTETAGNQTITATDTVMASLTGKSSSIATTAPATLAITSGAPPNGTVDTSYGGTRVTYELCTAVVCQPCSPTPIPGTCGIWPPCPHSKPCIAKLDFSGFTLNATGGVPPYSWNASSLPPGLGVQIENKEVDISGTPPAGSNATYKNVQVTVNDSGNPPAQMPATYTIVIKNPAPPIIRTTPAPPAGAVDLPYSFSFTADGGQQPLAWSAIGGLPQGISPLTFTGVLSGTPTITGPFSITVTAQDALGQNSTPQNFTISIFLHGFIATGSMSIVRTGYTQTLLGNGKVLVAGGWVPGTGPLATAELFDPATGTFAATGSMGTARTAHTATLLKDGTVLVAGGTDSNVDFATAELYDPTTGTFKPTTGNMTTAREGHTATLLNNNKVLVLGGSDTSGNGLTSAELYDPATGNFTPTGSMGTLRTGYVTTSLPNGKVLVAGGFDTNSTLLATAELYDPAAGTFAATGSLTTARSQDTATLLNTGKVLIAGGMDSIGTPVAIAELFDPVAGTFAPTGSMLTPRTQHTASLLNDGTVLLAGGYDHPVDQISEVSSAELFNPTSGNFAATGSMGITRIAHMATLLNDGRVLVTGGFSEQLFGYTATAELYQ